MALAIGVVWGMLWQILPFFYFNLLLAAGAGYAIGEVISLSANRKRGLGLQVIAGISLILCYLVSGIYLSPEIVAFALHFSLYDLLALGLGIFIAITRL